MSFWSIARDDPGRVATVGADGGVTTFGELLRQSRGLAGGLHRLSLRHGDTLAVVVPNVPSFFVAYLAALESGLYLTPVNTHLAAPEVAYVIADCEARAVVVHSSLAELASRGLDAAGVGADHRFADPDAPGFRPLREVVDAGAGWPYASSDRRPGGLMLYTSGTTGRPKGVRRELPESDPHELFSAISEVYCRGFGVEPGAGVHLVCGPLYHAGPLASATNALQAGNTVVLMDKWEPERCLELIERYRVTNTQMVPTMFNRLLGLPSEVRAQYDVSSLQSVMHTGAPCPMPVKQQMMEWLGPVVYETYGGTESVATIATPRRWLQKPGTVGRPIHGVTLHILDDDGNPCPTGEAGTIYIEHAGGNRAEYFKDPEKTSQMRRGDLVTLGDVGYVDGDGFLFLRDRKIDMIISGGVNIYPAEIEAVLLQCDLVVDVAVIGVPDDDWGERVLAIVELAAGVAASEATEELIASFCEGRIARFKRPREIEFVERLPRLPNGKIEKRRLREPYWRDRAQAI